MNDKIIISVISKTHFIISTIFSFIFLIAFLLSIALKNGIYINDISFNKFHFEKLYIKWDEKISLNINRLLVDSKKNINPQNQETILKNIDFYLNLIPYFEKINIQEFKTKDFEANIDLIVSQNRLNINSNKFNLTSNIYTDGRFFNIQINKFILNEKDLLVDGDVILDIKNSKNLSSKLNITIAQTTINLTTYGDDKELYYLISTDKPIVDKKEIVSIFNLDSEVRYWVDDAINMSTLELNKLNGWIDFNHLEEAYLNIYTKARANRLIYTYDQKLDGIKTEFTDLEFKDGVLHINPQKPYSYGFNLASSHLDIDFSKKEEILNLYLMFNGRLDKNILSLLKRYEIVLPLEQTKGQLDTDLKLNINLRTLDVEANGVFKTKEAQIYFLNKYFDIYNAEIDLKNTLVKTNKFLAKYKDEISSSVNLNLDAKNHNGIIDFNIDKFSMDDLTLNDKLLQASYYITKSTDTININKSNWRYLNKDIIVDSLKNISFNIDTLRASIPSTHIDIKEYLSMMAGGDIDFNKQQVDFKLDILESENENLLFSNNLNRLNLKYDNDLKIYSKNDIDFNLFGKKSTLKNFNATITRENIKLNNIEFNVEDMFSSKLDIIHKQAQSIFDVKSLNIKDNLYKNNDGFRAIIKEDKNNTYKISIKDTLEALVNLSGFSIKIPNLENITKYSPKLTGYKIGSGSLEAKKESQNILFDINIKDGYKLLTDENELIDKYFITGVYNTQNEKTSIDINDKININISDDIDVKASNIGVNVLELLDIIDINSDENSTEESKKLNIDAKNCYFYLSPNRFIISDTIKASQENGTLNVTLNHKNAQAKLQLQDKNFHFFGDNFDDEFMSKLFAKSKFKNGVLKFSMSGTTDKFDGIMLVENTTIYNYVVLNNILAFVNTIPSLLTFSLPGYNINGLSTNNIYMKFNYDKHVYNISDISLKSKEIEISGFGVASVLQNSIDMDLNLKTDIGSSVSKIPIIGSILMDKQSLSTTLKVDGKLDDPTIHTQLAKDIIVAPLNIIKRTLMLPFEIFNK